MEHPSRRPSPARSRGGRHRRPAGRQRPGARRGRTGRPPATGDHDRATAAIGRPVRIANCSRLLRRPAVGGPGDGGGRPDRRPHRRLPRRADDAHPLAHQAEATRDRLRRARSSRQIEEVLGTVPRPGHPDRHQRRRPQPGGLRGRRPRRSPSARADGPGRPRRGRRPARPHPRPAAPPATSSPTSTPGAPSTAAGVEPVTANAYLGGFGHRRRPRRRRRRRRCPRVTDAALVVGPAAWWHGWARDDWDAARRRRGRRPRPRVRRPDDRRQLRVLRARSPTSPTPASRSPRWPPTAAR